MDKLAIQLSEGQRHFRPSEPISGSVVWELDEPVEAIELQLRWSTRGKGDVDTEVVDRVRVEKPAARGEHSFCFTGPAGPISFSGKLISLIWTLRLMVVPTGREVQQAITISPTGREINLYSGK